MTTATLAAGPFTISEEIFVRATLENTFDRCSPTWDG